MLTLEASDALPNPLDLAYRYADLRGEPLGDVDSAQFVVPSEVSADRLIVQTERQIAGGVRHRSIPIGQFDASQFAGDHTAWRLFSEYEIPTDQQAALQLALQALEHETELAVRVRELGLAVDLRHATTLAARSLMREYVEQLKPQQLLNKTNRADREAIEYGYKLNEPPDICIVDEATVCYLAFTPLIGNKTEGVSLAASDFGQGFDFSFTAFLEGVRCYNSTPTRGEQYYGREDFQIPLVSYENPRWIPNPNSAVIAPDAQETVHDVAKVFEVLQESNRNFSAQFCGLLVQRPRHGG